MSAVKYIRDYLPHVELKLWVPEFFVEMAKHLVPEIEVVSFTERQIFQKEYGSVVTACQQHDTMSTHLVDHAFHVLVNKQVEIEHKNYVKLRPEEIDVSRFNLPKEYVVMPTGFTAKVREFTPLLINQIVKYIKKKNYNIEIIFLGSNNAPVGGLADAIRGNFNTDIQYHKGINLINRTTLLESAAIIAGAKCILGVDNGLGHIAGTTEIPIVTAYTTVNPMHRMPYRHNQLGWNCYNIIPDDSLECRFCKSNWNLVYNHDFRNCYYEDYKCKDQLYLDKWTKILDNIL